MPLQTNIMRIKSTYYFRIRIPQDLIGVIQINGKSKRNCKEIKRSLKTKDSFEAKRRSDLMRLEWNEEFAKLRRELAYDSTPPTYITKDELTQIAILWHREEVRKQTLQNDHDRLSMNNSEIEETIENIEMDLSILEGGNESEYAPSMQALANTKLEQQNIKLLNSNALYHHFTELLLQATIEQHYKSLERYGQFHQRQPFALFSSNTASLTNNAATGLASSPKDITWQELITKFKAAQISDNKSPRTIKSYKLTLDLTTEMFGVNKLISLITPEECRQFKDALSELPSNARKRFGDKPLLKIIKLNNKRPHKHDVLSPKSINGTITKLKALFNFAVKDNLLDKNPAQYITPIKAIKIEEEDRLPFSSEQLIKLFKQPIFTGCINDELYYAKQGSKHPRRHRFWIPLIGLYTGMRLNEICQLLVEDIIEEDGIYIINVVPTEDRSKTVKTKYSHRKIPINKELIKIGFIKYFKSTKKTGSKRLFPAMTKSKNESYSDNFSKWFRRFLKSSSLKEDGLCFHSFRHTFMDTMRELGTSDELVKRLGGWSPNKEVMYKYGKGFKIQKLKVVVDQISYWDVVRHV